MMSDKSKAYKADWQRKNSVIITIRLNKEKDDDILRWLELVPNKSVYIKRLINQDITKNILKS